jgi:hypothetical protein
MESLFTNNLPLEISTEIDNIEKVLFNIKEAQNIINKSTLELSGMAAFLQNFYNGIENIFKQTFKILKIDIPKGESWHKELLEKAVEIDVISEELSLDIYEYLAFRHFFIHSYGFMLEEAPIEELTDNIFEVWEKFKLSLNIFFKSI